MSGYQFEEIERAILLFWEKEGLYAPSLDPTKKAFVIAMPPPNVTGVLHMGHALVSVIQDMLIRYHRMKGFAALWVPGTDHAGIATQTVVEKEQIRLTGKRRGDFSREEFLQLIWQWKESSERRIQNQIKHLGCSCDWNRYAFTMDSTRSASVYAAFKKLFDEGLIYRGDYLVNWDPLTETALADDEVEYEERSSSLWYIRYPLAQDPTQAIVVATTRPETMLGDVAVAVHPQDPRYHSMVGKNLLLPLTNRQIPVIADPMVDPEFGTGAVKITPAHDPNDYEMGQRHNLPVINIMTKSGHINEKGAPFTGLSMEQARYAIVKELAEKKFLVDTKPHTHRVGVSYRSKAVIEPYLSKQWFIKMDQFKEPLIRAVKEGHVSLTPKSWEQTYFHWIENLRNWCISRQLWWGHRIPIWYHKKDPNRLMCIIDENELSALSDRDDWVQDPDVLDTWFSSALWPLSILGWPNNTEDFARFYPNTVLVTGHDILFFWVARMIMMGEHFTKVPPFKQVFLHGLIYGKSYWREDPVKGIQYVSGDERLKYDLGAPIPHEIHSKWEKMSKSKGNVIDPLEIASEYGTDALRLTLCMIATHARQIDLDRRRFEESKNFINKLWNGARFIFMQLENLDLTKIPDLSVTSLEDLWIFSRLASTIDIARESFASFQFDRLAQTLYHFFWDEFCAYYLELCKPCFKEKDSHLAQQKGIILLYILLTILKLLHPITPFVTEELFQTIKKRWGPIFATPADRQELIEQIQITILSQGCIVAPFPENSLTSLTHNAIAEEQFSFIQTIIHAIRLIRAEMQIKPSTMTDLWIEAPQNDPHVALLQKHLHIITSLVRIGHIHFAAAPCSDSITAKQSVGEIVLTIPLPQELQEKEKERLEKAIVKHTAQIHGMQTQLNNPSFMEKAPRDLVAKTLEQLQKLQQEKDQMVQALKQLLSH